MYQIYKQNKPISKPYPTKWQAFTECVEKGLVLHAGGRDWFIDDVEIKEVNEDKDK